MFTSRETQEETNVIVPLGLSHLKSLVQSARILVIKFHAEWCGPCKTTAPYYVNMANDLTSSTIRFVSIDIDGQSNTKLENDIKDIVDMLGFKLAYGIEYKFNDQLSFSTEYGFNYLWNKIDIEGIDLRAKLGTTYTLLSLNYSMGNNNSEPTGE